MKSIAEFRIPESYAKEFLPTDFGVGLMGFVRKVKVPVESEMYRRIGEIYKLVKTRDKKSFIYGWNIQRSYSKKELESAELLLVKIAKTFEPAGLECGTVYTTQNACEFCGTGIHQISELILDLNTVPKYVDIARTISNEIIISQELVNFFTYNNVTGYKFMPVFHKTPNYRKKNWFQLVNLSFVTVSPEIKTGNDPFDEDEDNEYRCKIGHTVGLNLLSELSIQRDSWDGNDIVATKELFGVNRGLLRTYSLLMVSQRLYRLLMEGKFKGFTVEVVKVVS